MNKKIALVTLIRHSLILPDATKIDLITSLPSLNDRQVEALGMFLAKEREQLLESESQIMARIDEILVELDKTTSRKPASGGPVQAEDQIEKLYVGSGKPV